MLSSFCAHCSVHENPEEQSDTHTLKNWIIIGNRLRGGGTTWDSDHEKHHCRGDKGSFC